MPNFEISTFELSEAAREWAQLVLVWIGFGTLVGLAAKAIMPGRDPGGSIVTLLLGIVGTVIGCGTLMLFTQGRTVTPVSIMGFAVGTGGALILLVFYRLLSGRLFLRGNPQSAHMRPPHQSRKGRTTIINSD